MLPRAATSVCWLLVGERVECWVWKVGSIRISLGISDCKDYHKDMNDAHNENVKESGNA